MLAADSGTIDLLWRTQTMSDASNANDDPTAKGKTPKDCAPCPPRSVPGTSSARSVGEPRCARDVGGPPSNLSGTHTVGECDGSAAQAGLCERCTLLRAVVEGTTDAIFVKDVQGRYLMANDAVARIVDKPVDTIIGSNDAALFPADTARRLMEDDRRVMDGGEAPRLETEIPVDGENRMFLSTKTAYRDHAGNVIGLIGISRDITERKRAQTALRESEERLTHVLDSAMDAIITMDEHRIIKLFNAAAEDVFRCSAAQAIGQSFDRFAAAGFREMVARCQHAFERGGVKKRYFWAPEGLTAVRADGEEFPVEATFSEAEASGQKLYTIILRDVNDRHQAEEALRRLELENVCLREEIGAGSRSGKIVSVSKAMTNVLQSIEQVAATDSTVLITGETGTGKELVAQAIHAASSRKDNMLVSVNCPALPHGLIESELFGHEKGAFTGALARKIGRFELANKGTIFLDEIGDLPGELQAKLLRALQEGEFERVGGWETLKVDVRVVAATNHDLDQAVQDGRFRADLYYRLNVFPIRIPPLRERQDDIPPLVRHFCMKYNAEMGKKIEAIPKPGMRGLRAYTWPGNVRELQNVIERAMILSRGSQLDLGEWPPTAAGPGGEHRILSLEDIERQHILKVLELVGWRVSGDKGAAKLLGMKPTTLESRMKRLGITRHPL